MVKADPAALVTRLQALHELERTRGLLIAEGEAAVPALRHYLLDSAPEVLFEPRRAAAQALGVIGSETAKQALLAYLRMDRLIHDPVRRLAEETVESTAARELARWPGADVTATLLDCCRRGARPGLLDTLAELQCRDAIPYCIAALEDAVCEASAIRALRRFGRAAEWPLLHAARTPEPSVAEERPVSRERRRRALVLLAELPPSTEAWPWVVPLLDDSGDGIALEVAAMMAARGSPDERRSAAARLQAAAPGATWYDQIRIREIFPLLHAGAMS